MERELFLFSLIQALDPFVIRDRIYLIEFGPEGADFHDPFFLVEYLCGVTAELATRAVRSSDLS